MSLSKNVDLFLKECKKTFKNSKINCVSSLSENIDIKNICVYLKHTKYPIYLYDVLFASINRPGFNLSEEARVAFMLGVSRRLNSGYNDIQNEYFDYFIAGLDFYFWVTNLKCC